MKRKLVKQGAVTLMISLPSKWVKKNNLEKGSEINLEEKNNDLVIDSDSKEAKKETSINLTSTTESSIRTIITNAYRIGYDKINLGFEKKDFLKIIEEVIKNNLIGFEISKKDNKSCEIESITEPSKDQFDNIFSKVLLNISELFSIAEKSLKGEKEEFEDLERKIQQFDNFCRRIISKESVDKGSLIWAFHTLLIHAQREIYLMLKYLSKNNIKPEKEIINLLNECKNIFNNLKKGYEEKDLSILEKVHDLDKDISYNKGYGLLKKGKNSIIIHHIISASRNFYLASSPLIGIIPMHKG